jgi:hypothetical protein
MDVCNISFKTNINRIKSIMLTRIFSHFITNLCSTKVIFCINTMNYKDLMEEYKHKPFIF